MRHPYAIPSAPAGKAAALSYAKQHFAPHAARHLRDIQRLMGCLVFAPPPRTPHTDPHGATSTTTTSSTCMREAQQGADGGGGGATGAGAGAGGSEAGGGGGGGGGGGAGHPYADLMAPAAWDAAAREFARLACSLMGQVGKTTREHDVECISVWEACGHGRGSAGGIRDDLGSPAGTAAAAGALEGVTAVRFDLAAGGKWAGVVQHPVRLPLRIAPPHAGRDVRLDRVTRRLPTAGTLLHTSTSFPP